MGAASAAIAPAGTPITADMAGPFAEIAKPDAAVSDGSSFPATAALCHKCSTKALVLMDGCKTCLNCRYGKCG